MNAKTKSLIGYIFPALGGLFVTYLYNVVDGIFVGQGVGSAALGAVNIGVPFITFVVAAAAMFPMAVPQLLQSEWGRGDKAGANHAFMTAFSLTILLSALLMVVGMTCSMQIVDLSGARKLSAKCGKCLHNIYSIIQLSPFLCLCLPVFLFLSETTAHRPFPLWVCAQVRQQIFF